MPRKLNSSSTFAKLTHADRAEVDALLLDGKGYDDVLAFLKERGLTCSRTSVAEYYQRHVLPEHWARKQQIARQLAALKGGEEMTAAATNAVRQKVMDLAIQPGADAKMVKMLFTLVLQAQAQELDARRVKLLEQKAAAADAAKAALEKKVSQGGLTPEALALAEEQLKLL